MGRYLSAGGCSILLGMPIISSTLSKERLTAWVGIFVFYGFARVPKCCRENKILISDYFFGTQNFLSVLVQVLCID